jgi:hypothetical protein
MPKRKPLQVKERPKIPVEEAGRPLDFSEAGLGTPVVHVKVASVFSVLAPDDVHLKVEKAQVFRPEGWEVALIITEEIKAALDCTGATGTRFEEV